jgi:hypothetical protein
VHLQTVCQPVIGRISDFSTGMACSTSHTGKINQQRNGKQMCTHACTTVSGEINRSKCTYSECWVWPSIGLQHRACAFQGWLVLGLGCESRLRWTVVSMRMNTTQNSVCYSSVYLAIMLLHNTGLHASTYFYSTIKCMVLFWTLNCLNSYQELNDK